MEGLADNLQKMAHEQWYFAVSHLRELHLITAKNGSCVDAFRIPFDDRKTPEINHQKQHKTLRWIVLIQKGLLNFPFIFQWDYPLEFKTMHDLIPFFICICYSIFNQASNFHCILPI
jgi:hypothetical protein